eukprot:PhF_6_TR13607/c0_g1_i1/m.21777
MYKIFLLLTVFSSIALSANSDIDYLMMMVQNITTLPDTWNRTTPPCRWIGNQCNETSQTVIALTWSSMNLAGTLNFSAIPPNVEMIDVGANQLVNNPLDLTSLPQGKLKSLFLSSNQFGGPLDLTKLPPTVHHIDLSYNQITGTSDLTKLPVIMDRLKLNNNQFCGTMTAASPSSAWCRTFDVTGVCGTVDATLQCPQIICPTC